MELNMLSLFSGIGAFEKALENIGIKINLKNFCEIDKYATQAYCAIHNIDKKLNLNDITKIDIESLPTEGIDIISHGSPCQDFSMSGLQAGGDIGTGTRSSLMWNSVAIIKHVKPKYVIWENVKNVLSKKHKHNFEKYLKSLEDIGYNNYCQVLNAKDYGVPQNRERIFVISIRKDIDKGSFKFPEKQILQLKLKDLLDDEVDEKFYLKDSQIERIKDSTILQENKDIKFKGAYGRNFGSRGKLQNKICNTLQASMGGGGGNVPLVKEDTYISKRYENFYNDNGYIPEMFNPYNKNEIQDIAPTQTANCGSITSSAAILKKNVDFKIRKLTPKECWRLMGFSDEDFQKASDTGLSNTQLYKQAGNSIVVNVLEEIFKNLFLN